jgi:hypothetical protein
MRAQWAWLAIWFALVIGVAWGMYLRTLIYNLRERAADRDTCRQRHAWLHMGGGDFQCTACKTWTDAENVALDVSHVKPRDHRADFFRTRESDRAPLRPDTEVRVAGEFVFPAKRRGE